MEETEKRILEAAREEFITTGLKGARMQVIADRASVNKALLHYYFRTKEKLYVAALTEIAESLWGSIEEQMIKLDQTSDLKKMITVVVSTYIKTLSSNPLFMRIVIREIADGGTIFSDIIKSALAKYGKIPHGIITAITNGINKGEIRSDLKPVDIFMNIMGMCIITFVVMPIAKKILPDIGVTLEFNDAFYQSRITSIVQMACDGIFVKDVTK